MSKTHTYLDPRTLILAERDHVTFQTESYVRGRFRRGASRRPWPRTGGCQSGTSFFSSLESLRTDEGDLFRLVPLDLLASGYGLRRHLDSAWKHRLSGSEVYTLLYKVALGYCSEYTVVLKHFKGEITKLLSI
ncbi:hypothetical protein ETB97_004569 [Aspergillus alliaceus]|uniref:Uncharacterized protein n=1 Tax=Petromyces alliaceus TaxID=209559 RepID=A0A8H6E4P6_PETAA|nr:hypothetical protein ETB97_004569 [Aspergillus burnettii]